jgi:y4mF family transcriptional regulator
MEPIEFNQLSAAIRYHRKKSGLTQLELAEMADVGKTLIFDLEKGRKTIQVNHLMKVLSILNIRMYFESSLMTNKDDE